MLADDERLELGGGRAEGGGEQTAEAQGVEERAEPDDVPVRQAELLLGQIGEDVDGIGDDQHDRVLAHPGGADRRQDRAEELDVAVDEREPAFVGLAPQAGGDADHPGVGDVGIAARPDRLVGDRRGAVEEIERLAVGELGVGIDEDDLVDDPPELERETGRRADDPAATHDSDFHRAVPLVLLRCMEPFDQRRASRRGRLPARGAGSVISGWGPLLTPRRCPVRGTPAP